MDRRNLVSSDSLAWKRPSNLNAGDPCRNDGCVTGITIAKGELEVPEREPSIFVNILSSMHSLFIP